MRLYQLSIAVIATSIPLRAEIRVEPSLPAGALISNPDVLDGAGSDDGSSRFAFTSTTSNYFVKGESFTLADPADLTAVTIRVDENSAINDGMGDVTLSIYNLSGMPDDTQATGHVPIGAALVSQTETLPAIVAGDYLTIALDTPLNLNAGSYAFALSTTNVDFSIDINRPGNTNATRNGTYPEYPVFAKSSKTKASKATSAKASKSTDSRPSGKSGKGSKGSKGVQGKASKHGKTDNGNYLFSGYRTRDELNAATVGSGSAGWMVVAVGTAAIAWMNARQ